MTIQTEAIYENGVLRPTAPLPPKEGEVVRVTVESKTSWVEATYGIMGWKGSDEVAEFFATDVDLLYPDEP